MPNNPNRAAFFYWLIALIGFLASFGYFTKTMQRWVYGTYWIPATLGLSGFGIVMMYQTIRELTGKPSLGSHHKLLTGIAGGLVFGALLHFSIYLGYLVFLVYYLYLLFIFCSLIYFGFKIRRLRPR
ncbi:MAG: hypothetical protein D6800_07520 [Candidatus Zixiibacteriota bacterium]|nr:MAG: hypothetical protein D6800_07520 [candidate division Zixibacteria bacterium]